MESFPLRKSLLQEEGELRCSKWLKHAFLLSKEQMESLWNEMPSCTFVSSSSLVTESSWQISLEDFLARYDEYLVWMKTHSSLPPSSLRRFFSLMLTVSLDALYAAPVAGGKIAIKARLPVVHMQMHHCFLSPFDHQIRSMVMSKESFAFGIQIAYPQVFEDPNTHQFAKVLLEETFPNTLFFKQMISWIRKHTVPVSWEQKGEKLYAPFRIGKLSHDEKLHHQGWRTFVEKGPLCG